MKPSFKLLFSLAVMAGSISAQHCLPEGIVFTRQSQIDSFSINYPGCSYIDGHMEIAGAQSDITSLTGLAQVQSIKGDFKIHDLEYVTNLQGLNQVNSIDGQLRIEHNEGLLSLAGLNQLHYTKGLLNIQANNNLYTLQGLDSLRYVETLWIRENARLQDLSGLENFDSVHYVISISTNPGLKSLQGLNKLDIIHGDITISNNDSLFNLSGLNNLNTLFGNLWILGNEYLSSLEGLDALKVIYGDFLARENGINSFKGLNHLEKIGGSFTTSNNPHIQNFLEFASLSSAGYLIIEENPALISLAGLEGLHSIKGIGIEFNPLLTDLSGLIHVSNLTGNLIIKGNAALINLTGLDSLSLIITNDLEISQNAQLSQCAVASICNHLYHAGNYYIDFNAPGCNTREEIINDCLTPVSDPTFRNEIIVYPNPTVGPIQIKDLQFPNTILNIYDLQGNIIRSTNLSSNNLDMGDLPEGMYILSFKNEHFVFNQKVIKN